MDKINLNYVGLIPAITPAGSGSGHLTVGRAPSKGPGRVAHTEPSQRHKAFTARAQPTGKHLFIITNPLNEASAKGLSFTNWKDRVSYMVIRGSLSIVAPALSQASFGLSGGGDRAAQPCP